MPLFFGHEHLLTDQQDHNTLDHAGHDHGQLSDQHDNGWLQDHGAAHDGYGLHTMPAQLSHGWHVPWQQLTPESMTHDADGDGISDALDNHVGPGA